MSDARLLDTETVPDFEVSSNVAGTTGAQGLPHFFFIEEQFATDTCARFSRDALLSYLLICSGYNPRYRASLYGSAGAMAQMDVTRRSFVSSLEKLERLGLVHVIARDTRHPRTLIAALDHPFESGEEVRDGHRYDALTSESDLILLPMKLVYGDLEYPSARLSSLESVDGIRLLLWLYRETAADGYLRSDRFWWRPSEDLAVSGAVSARAQEALGIEAETAAEALRTLIDLELLRVEGDLDAQGRGILRLRHVVESRNANLGANRGGCA